MPTQGAQLPTWFMFGYCVIGTTGPLEGFDCTKHLRSKPKAEVQGSVCPKLQWDKKTYRLNALKEP